ncbi:MAG: sensor histidine kinase [Solirubrobacteraceae bacterium]
MADGANILEAAHGPLHQLALLAGTIDDYAILLLDPDGRVLTWNPGAQRNTGYAADEVLGEPHDLFSTPEDRLEGRPQEALTVAERDGSFREEGWRVRKDGSRFWGNVLVTALRADGGELLGFGKVVRDMTELRAVQQELELFAASAAHDLQEPLRTISGFTELLAGRHGDALPDDGRAFLDHIAGAAERMQRLIADLLDYARSAPGEARSVPVSLNGAVREMLAAVQGALAGRGMDIGVDVPEGAAVRADGGGVELLLQNLVSNAIKFADAERPVVSVRARRADQEWIVTVADNGRGIPDGARERIFQPFAQLRHDDEVTGTGLGLSIARRIVQRHGGRIGVDPAEGGGSAFWFALPAAD